MKNLEVVTRQEVLQVGTDLDKKVEAHKEYLETAVNNVHSSLKNQILEDQSVVAALTARVNELESIVEKRLGNLETTMYPQIQS